MRNILLLISLTLISTHSLANYHCEGKISHIGLSDQTLHVNNGYGVHRICDLNVDNKSCASWMSLALAAKMADKKIVLSYRHNTIIGNQATGQCLAHGSWVTPSDPIYYIEIN